MSRLVPFLWLEITFVTVAFERHLEVMLRETSVICPGERVCGCTIDCAGDFVLIAFGPRRTFRNITVPMVFFECLSVSSVSFSIVA